MTDFFNSPMTAVVAGLVTSVHCAGMCGPLACAVTDRERPYESAFLYHSGRFFAYTIVGGLAGGLGSMVTPLVNSGPIKFLPIAFAIFFLLVAFGWDKGLPLPGVFGKISRWLTQRAVSLPKPIAALTLGLGTPFLPCGPLYLAIGVVLFAGSMVTGAMLMAAFIAGTIPVLVLLQLNWSWLSGKLSPQWLRHLQRAVALMAAAMVIWRALGGATLNAPHGCPLCH